MVNIYISLGSNINRQYHLEQGLNALSTVFGQLTLSSLFESDAVGFNGRPFYNMVIGVQTTLSLVEVASNLREIEFANGRSVHAKKFSPRTLDLDLLLYGDVIAEQPAQIPRAEIQTNAFVLWPLAEVAGHKLHPLLGESYKTLWNNYDKSQQNLKIVPLLWTAPKLDI
jgi:2-amino-4-hydroxy-6-hydroxymethyldihydropteridine diphosphokinase